MCNIQAQFCVKYLVKKCPKHDQHACFNSSDTQANEGQYCIRISIEEAHFRPVCVDALSGPYEVKHTLPAWQEHTVALVTNVLIQEVWQPVGMPLEERAAPLLGTKLLHLVRILSEVLQNVPELESCRCIHMCAYVCVS
jgi:hypothetical protein